MSIDSFTTNPPRSICILRLSALGDVCNTLPAVRAIQRQWPDCRITWVIGKAEAMMLEGIDGIELIVYDKKSGIKGALELRRYLQGRQFDVLLHMQSALRASLLSLCISAKLKIGFDQQRAKDHQTWFTNQQIKANPRAHVLETFLDFAHALDVRTTPLIWDIPIAEENRQEAQAIVPSKRYMLISPCSNQRSRNFRNWSASGYAQLIDYAYEKHNLTTVITGGTTAVEKQMGTDIEQLSTHPPTNLMGKTSLKTLLALIDQARLVVGPDSGPMHMASATQTPAIGLYASTNPDRARSYSSPEWVVNRFADQTQKVLNKHPDDLPLSTRVRTPDAMKSITPAEVNAMLDKLLAETDQ